MRYDINTGVTGRRTAKHTARNFAIGGVVILLLLVGAGFAYTYYFGPEGNIQEPVKEAPKSGGKIRKPVKPSPNAPESAAITALSTPIPPGSNASVNIKTNPDSKCTISVKYNNVPSTDSGLAAKTADEYGLVTWTWTVEPTVPQGTWPIGITCTWNGKSAYVEGRMVVSKDASAET